MKKLYLHLFIFLSSISACNQSSHQAKDQAQVIISTKAIQQMDALEKLFNNDNWMKVVDKDTSYFNFSRNQNVTRVYNYKLSKGDSVDTKLSEITISNDSLLWHYNDATLLYLDTINNTNALWKLLRNISVSGNIIYEKKTGSEITVTESTKKYFLIKTLPLSTFLVRSHYDFIHGTKYAFADTTFTTKNKKGK